MELTQWNRRKATSAKGAIPPGTEFYSRAFPSKLGKDTGKIRTGQEKKHYFPLFGL